MFSELYEEENGLSIADRTISLQFRQFRTPRKELKQLTLNNKKTYLLSEAEKQKYEKCLDGIDGNLLNSTDDINVDIEGFSIEIAKRLGNNYLRNNYILISPKQIEYDSIRDNYFNKNNRFQNTIIRKIFNTHRNVIEQILMGEALVGIVNQKELSLLKDNPESLFNIEIVFDTPNNAISKLKNIRNDERKLLEDIEKLKDRTFLKNLLQNIEEVSVDHGSLDRIPDKEINLKEKVDFNKLRLNDIDIYCLRTIDGKMIFVYFDYDDNDGNVIKENLNDDIIILNGRDIDSLAVLMELGMVGYNPYIGLERAANIVLRDRIDNKIENRNENIDIPERAKELLKAVELLIKNKRDKDFFNSLGRIKTYMIYPLIQNHILYELLSRMENNEYKSCYMDTEKFIQMSSNMKDEELREFIEKILDSLEFIEENNIMVNTWLMENRENVCNDIGIKFVKN